MTVAIKTDLQKLVDAGATSPTFAPLPDVGKRAEQTAVGRQQASSGGLSLEEADYAAREYWPTVNVTSTDGLITLQEKPIKSILLADGSRATFKQPT